VLETLPAVCLGFWALVLLWRFERIIHSLRHDKMRWNPNGTTPSVEEVLRGFRFSANGPLNVGPAATIKA
jgi:hypothetical protein